MGANRKVNAIIFFDGECNLCNSFVTFVIRRDLRKEFVFSSLQSSFAKNTLKEVLTKEGVNTVILQRDGFLFYKSDAALEVLRKLSGAWPVFYSFKIVPKIIRDLIYDWIAANRHRWFGKSNCLIPSADLKARFME